MSDPKFSPAALRAARKRWKHTQQEAAYEMHVALSSVTAWENARKTPTGVYMRVVLDYILGSKKRKSSE
jgi:DNA-binding transcriptional regulator YiaG